MRRNFILVLGIVLLAGVMEGQTPTTPADGQPGAPQAGPTLASGAVIGAELSKSIDAKKAKVGQEVVAKSRGDLRDTNGNLVIPKGAKIIGHVTQAKAASKQDPQSNLGIIFDKVEVKHGKEAGEIGMHAGIQALAKPQPSSMMQEQEPAGAPGGSGAAPSGGRPGMGGGSRPGGMPSGSGAQAQGQGGEAGGSEGQAGAASNGPAITANSHGVIGDSNLTLSPQASPTEGSVITSGHGNVKLDSGTLLVLRVIGQ